ncbi:TPA: cation acetate symporter [Klebsiella michiganensis]|uniref:Cation acetate symporter n=1 Tax=Klebsiella pasteurii TaxID=2587529 RepID=A0ABT5CVG3_9ENTR|nr:MULTISPECIES: cation acetate symporter [Klebsiella]HBW5067349.1 cation acetate symporter [Klebsiella pneumoniae]MBZ6572443.1 cation acetate symporter [Klebsiella grimontii]MBZ7379407.1 cation acetate symporter [Klebsiella grimontii]MDC0694890.1 cation acetate symporter [Klebsiella pasteurii]WKH77798.1 cation acetate symporter [Klebsiella quasipneumoniae]
MKIKMVLVALLPGLLSGAANAADSMVGQGHKNMTFTIFTVLFLASLSITWFASRKNSSAGDFYTAGGQIGPLKNGLAIAGDYLSAAAFLGVSGLIALYGFDGVNYLIGFFVAFIPVLLLVAEPCRNLGRYTLGDVLAWRNGFRATKFVAAVSSVIVALFYMVPQIVGGAVIVRALIGIPYEISVIAVGLLMLIYVAFGGMRATTAVQVTKAVLLISCCFILVVLSWLPFGFNGLAFFNSLTVDHHLQQYVLSLVTDPSFSPQYAGQRFLEAGLYLKKPVEQVSLGLALLLGTAAMPHVLMRFFAVRNSTDARKSVLWSMLFIGVCHLFIIVIGFACAYYLGADVIKAADKGGNLAAPLLAQYLGGGADSFTGNFLLAMVAAISFATIVAVVAGLTLAAASAMAHDVYVGAIKNGVATERQQVGAAKIATLLMAVVAVIAGIEAKGQNVAHLVGLGYAVAASANLPALVMSLYWRRCNTAGVIAGIVGGTVLAIAMVMVSPSMTYPLNQRAALENQLKTLAADEANASERLALKAKIDAIPENATSIVGLKTPLIELSNPGIVSVPTGFLLVIVFSLLFRDERSERLWPELAVRRELGTTL